MQCIKGIDFLQQALLEGISLSQPQPKLPSELIKFLGKTYNAWHIAIPLLESHVVLFPHVSHVSDAVHVHFPPVSCTGTTCLIVVHDFPKSTFVLCCKVLRHAAWHLLAIGCEHDRMW